MKILMKVFDGVDNIIPHITRYKKQGHLSNDKYYIVAANTIVPCWISKKCNVRRFERQFGENRNK